MTLNLLIKKNENNLFFFPQKWTFDVETRSRLELLLWFLKSKYIFSIIKNPVSIITERNNIVKATSYDR
jgi:hypothetical protein